MRSGSGPGSNPGRRTLFLFLSISSYNLLKLLVFDRFDPCSLEHLISVRKRWWQLRNIDRLPVLSYLDLDLILILALSYPTLKALKAPYKVKLSITSRVRPFER